MSATLLTAIMMAIYWRNVECVGEIPTSFFTFIAILFTSGLDVGLIMFPMLDFQVYAEDAAYAFVYADIKARQRLFDPANKEKAYQIMIDLGYEIPPAFVELYQVELDQISPDGGFESAAAMDKFVADLQLTGDLPEGIDWRQYVDMKYVWAAQEALGIPKRPASL